MSRRWSDHHCARWGHGLRLVGIGVICTIGAAAAAQEADQVVAQTNGLLRIVGQYHHAPTPQRAAMLEHLRVLAAERRAMLLQEAATNPARFLRHALPKDAARRLPRALHAFVEEDVSLEGEFSALQVDDFAGHRSEVIYQVHQRDGVERMFRLRFAQGQPELLSGAHVHVEGVALDSELVVAQAGGSTFQPTAQAAATVSGDQRTIVMLLNFSNDGSRPWSPAQVYDTLFVAANSTNRYYQDASYGFVSFSGDAVGWYTIPYDNTGCNYNTWASAADSAATAAGVSLSGYTRKVYLFPRTGSCGWAGLGTIGGNPSRAWINGYNDSSLFSHELGHNLGMHHAASLSCGAQAIDAYTSCTVSEYGDRFDVMGSWNLFHWNGPHKLAGGWVPVTRLQTVSAPGTFSLAPLERDESTTQVLKIAKPDTNEAYYVSYRQPVGMDASLPSGMTQGVSVHVWNGSAGTKTKLLDTSPGDGFGNAALADGASFHDALNNVTVRQVAHDPTAATVEVMFAAAPCTPATPTPSVSPISQAGSAGQSLAFSVSVKNNDSGACSDARFDFSNTLPGGWSGTISPVSLTVAPGGSGSATWTVTSSSTVLDGGYPIAVAVSDASEPAHDGSAAATYVVMSDAAPPSVRITNPPDGARVGRRPTIKAVASDESGIAQVAFLIDGVQEAVDIKAPYVYRWDTTDDTKDAHGITVKAKDNAGNEATASITVYVK